MGCIPPPRTFCLGREPSLCLPRKRDLECTNQSASKQRQRTHSRGVRSGRGGPRAHRDDVCQVKEAGDPVCAAKRHPGVLKREAGDGGIGRPLPKESTALPHNRQRSKRWSHGSLAPRERQSREAARRERSGKEQRKRETRRAHNREGHPTSRRPGILRSCMSSWPLLPPVKAIWPLWRPSRAAQVPPKTPSTVVRSCPVAASCTKRSRPAATSSLGPLKATSQTKSRYPCGLQGDCTFSGGAR